MFGLLCALGFWGVAAGKAVYDNIDMKNYSRRVDEDGNVHYLDRHANEYINGERTYHTGYTDSRGRYHHQEIGVRSGKVLSDKVRSNDDVWVQYEDEKIARAKKNGNLAVCMYQLQFKRPVVTEFSTGKVIAVLMKYYKNHELHYRKFYAAPNAREWEYNREAKGDIGIEITKEEYDNLKRVYPETYSNLCNVDTWDALLNGEVE